MALDIAQLVQSYNAGTRALLKAAGLPESMFGDQAAAAVPTQTPQPPARAAGSGPALGSPGANYLAGASKYAAAHGGRPGLLEALAQRRGRKLNLSGAAGVPAISGRVRLIGNDAGTDAVSRLTHIAKGGASAGQAYQAFDLGGGRTAHVYYDENGKRRVVTMQR